MHIQYLRVNRDAGISTSETYHKGLMIFLFFCHDFPKSLVLLVDLCLCKITDEFPNIMAFP